MSKRASAPGKIVLSGEYAVLFGAPAVCMAVNRRAVASVRHTRGDCAVHTAGFAGADRFRVVDAVSPGGRPQADIDLDTSAFAEGGMKLGIGSSAALTVALTAALADSVNVLEPSLAAHMRLQGGAGSGVDVAAAVHGGLIRYTAVPPAVRCMAWPAGIAFRVVWTGVAAGTGARLARLSDAAPQPSREALIEQASAMADRWSSGNAEEILGAYPRYIEALRRFGVDHDLGIFDAGHDALTEAAMADGLIYKPAGAGGGDIGVLFGLADDALEAFVERHAALVHRIVPCTLDPDGVRLEAP